MSGELEQWARDAGVQLSSDFIKDYESLIAARDIAKPMMMFEGRKIQTRKLDMED